jgi:rubredoxin
MKNYECTVCGYIYSEAAGMPDEGIAPGTKWEDLPDDWTCPMCGATKDEFEEQAQAAKPLKTNKTVQAAQDDDMRELSAGEMSALCSNLAKGCEKQYRSEESALFAELAQYYGGMAQSAKGGKIDDLIQLMQQDLSVGYPEAKVVASEKVDRGALRALVWGEKVTKILSSLLARYEKTKGEFIKNTNVFVCEICGFVYVGDQAPEICPVCKVPGYKIHNIKRGA